MLYRSLSMQDVWENLDRSSKYANASFKKNENERTSKVGNLSQTVYHLFSCTDKSEC